MTMEARSADLSALRINRNEDPPPGGVNPKLVKGLVGTLIAVVVLAVAYIAWQGFITPAIEVKLTTVAYSSPSQSNAVLNASGYVVAQRKASVASKATGRLVYLGVVEGDRVIKDQIIARLEDGDIKAQLEQARANLKLSEADLLDARRSLERAKTLLEKGLTTQADYDAADARYQRVLASIEVAKATVEQANVALENTRIRAPFDGTVLTKNADVGEMVVPMAASVGSRSAVVTIADMNSLQVEADVSESNIERITLGQPCEITLDAYPDHRYQAYVAKIVPTADRSKATVMVKVGFTSYDKRVLPEMSAKVLFLNKEAPPTKQNGKPILTLASTAIAERNGRKVVFIVENDRAVEVPISVGNEAAGLVEIKDGIMPEQRVIDKVDGRIHNGVKVSVK